MVIEILMEPKMPGRSSFSVRVVDCVGAGGVGTISITIVGPGASAPPVAGEVDNRDGHLTVGWLASEAMRRTADASGALAGTASAFAAAAHRDFVIGVLLISEQAPVLVSSPRGVGLTSLGERARSFRQDKATGQTAQGALGQAVVTATLAPRQIARPLELSALRLMCEAAGQGAAEGAQGGGAGAAAAATAAAEAETAEAEDLAAAVANMRMQLREVFACDASLVDVRTAAVARWLRSGGSEVSLGEDRFIGAAAGEGGARVSRRISATEAALASLRARYTTDGPPAGSATALPARDLRVPLGAELRQLLRSSGQAVATEAAVDVLLLPLVDGGAAMSLPAPISAPGVAAVAAAPAAEAGGSEAGGGAADVAGGCPAGAALGGGAAEARLPSVWPAAPPSCAGSEFNVRCGPNYKKTGKKVPSAEPWYDVVSATPLLQGRGVARKDWAPAVHKSGAPISASHVAQAGEGGALAMPVAEEAGALAARWPGQGGRPGEGGSDLLPPLFILNFMMPLTAPAVRPSSGRDPGCNFIFVCSLKEETRRALEEPREAWPAGLRLLVDWVAEAPSNPKVSGCFKLITQVVDMKDLGLGSFIEGYNGKPVLITKSGTIYQGPGYFEMDADVHNFNVLARKTLKGMHRQLPRVRAQVGFVIQGTANDELPEQMLACCELPDCDFLPLK